MTWGALLSSAASAFQPLITDDTGTQGARGNQVELAYNRTVEKEPGARETAQDVAFVFTRGITDALDIYAGIAAQRLKPEGSEITRGLGNPAVGAKWRFFESEARGLSLALKPEVRFPVSSGREARGLGTGRTSYGVGLLGTQEMPFGAVHANAVVDRVRYDDSAIEAAERSTLWRLSVAPVWDVAERWKLALDAGITTNPSRSESSRMGYVELGAIYSPSKDLDVAVGVIRNVSDGAARTTRGTVGVTGRFR
jgi:hypothetical protein